MKKHLFIFVFVLLSFYVSALTEVKKWEPYEIRFIAQNSYENPYVQAMPHNGEALLRVIFTGTSGEAKGLSYTMEGFWDGDLEKRNTFRIRFAPPQTGIWQYESFSADPRMNGIKGEIICTDWTDQEKLENPTRRGHIQVNKEGNRAGRYFEYADGTPFLWIADIWSYWTKKGINFSSFQEVVKDRAKKGFTVGMMRFSSNRRGVPLDASCDRLDNSEMRRIDGMIAYANSQGLSVWVLHWWGGNYIREVGEEKMRRFNRYLVARLGAYNVMWVAAGEYNLDNYAGLEIDFWKKYGAYIKSIDPYKNRVLSIHHAPPTFTAAKEAPQWSTGELLSKEPWMDFNQFQVGHQANNNERIPGLVRFNYLQENVKPVICTEPKMEFLVHSTPADYIRFAAWSAILSGAAGHTYGAGGIWIANVPEAPANLSEYDYDWYYKALNYTGGRNIGYLSKFFQGMRWWELEPNQKIIAPDQDNYCSASAGKEYVIFLRHGGSVKLDLSDVSSRDNFSCSWFNPRTGVSERAATVPGGGSRTFTAADNNDWVLHLVKKQSGSK